MTVKIPHKSIVLTNPKMLLFTPKATLAQLVEQLFCKQWVVSSNLTGGLQSEDGGVVNRT
jgi:hypothetical protein